jgi:glycosyltransferase involved in cell wall biosynthesis
MRVLLVSQQLATVRSGVGTYTRGLAAHLPSLGVDVSVLTPDAAGRDAVGTPTVPLPARSALDPTPGGWWSVARHAGAWLAARDWTQQSFDLVHFTDAREALHLPAHLPAPIVGTVHDDYALTSPRRYARRRQACGDPVARGLYYGWLRRVEPRAYAKLSHLVVNSEHVARSLAHGYGISRHRMTVVRIGIEPAPELAPLPLAGTPSLLFVGGNFFRKGLPTLLAAAARVRPQFPHIRVHVVGEDRNLATLMRRARQGGVPWEMVTLHGWRAPDELRRMIAGATVLALPSRVEAFGLVLVEAMSVGTPVIASRSGGSGELVEDDRSGLLVDPDDTAGLAAAITRLAEDHDLRARLALGGRARASTLTPTRTAEETLAVYRSVLGSRPRE